MIFGRNRVSYNDFDDVAATRSSLQASISLATAKLWPLFAKGGVLLGTPNEDSHLIRVIDLMVVGRAKKI